MSGTAKAFYGFAAIITVLLFISKFNGGFDKRFEYVFSPLIVALTGGGMFGIMSLFGNRSKEVVVDANVSPYLQYHLEKRHSYNMGISTIEPLLGVAVLMQLAEWANKIESGRDKHPDADTLGMTVLFALIVSTIYRLRRERHVQSAIMINTEGEAVYLDWSKNTRFPILGILVNQFFNLLGATTMVCAGGACNSLYISTITMFFSSVGISLTDWVPYMNGLGFAFVLFALLSLYSAKKSFLYPPFIIGAVCSVVILLNLMHIFTNLYSLIIANVGMVVCSCLNLKMNTASMPQGRRRKKK